MSELKEKLAREISAFLLDEIGPENLTKIIVLNRLDAAGKKKGTVCNGRVLFERGIDKVGGLTMMNNNMDPFSDEDCKLFEESYELARAKEFFHEVIDKGTFVQEGTSSDQAESRMHRKGQPETVIHEITVSDDLDKEVENLLSEKQAIGNELKKFNLADAEIAKLKEQYSILDITGVDDQEGYKKVEEAIKFVTKKISGVEKVRKNIKDFYLKTGKAIDGESNRLKKSLTDIKEPLEEKKKKIDDIFETLRVEAENKAKETLNYRLTELAKYNYATDITALGLMKDDAFEVELQYAKDEYQKEQDRKKKLDEDTAQLEADKQKLADEKAEFEKQKQAAGLVTEEKPVVEATLEVTPHPTPGNQVFMPSSGSYRTITPKEEKKEESVFSLEDPFDKVEELEMAPLKPKPSMEFPDTTNLLKMVVEYMDFIDNDEAFTHNNDFPERITEEAIKLVYGPAGVEFLKSRRP